MMVRQCHAVVVNVLSAKQEGSRQKRQLAGTIYPMDKLSSRAMDYYSLGREQGKAPFSLVGKRLVALGRQDPTNLVLGATRGAARFGRKF